MYIVALLLIGAVALVGVRSIGGILTDKCTVDYISFKSRIILFAQEHNNYGAVTPVKLQAPCDYRVLCLIDAQATRLPATLSDSSTENQELLEAYQYTHFKTIVADKQRHDLLQNVFLIDNRGFIEPVGYARQILVNPKSGQEGADVRDNLLCVRVSQGSFNLVLEGQGRTTLFKSS